MLVVALYATQAPDRFLSVHGALAAEGVLAVPARTAEVALALAPVLSPQLLLSDLLLPPRGGIALLTELRRTGAGGPRLLVAPERWRGRRRGLPPGVGVLEFPPDVAAVAPVVRKVVPAGTPPFPRLPSRSMAQSLMRTIERLLEDGDVAARGVPADHRPEVGLVRWVLWA
jgi:hypothetical protein